MPERDLREIDVVERPAIPWLAIVLGFGPVLLIGVGAAAAWLTGELLRDEIIIATGTYAAAILAFLAGVRRGSSFRTEGAPTPGQLATTLGLFILALFALLALGNSLTTPAIVASATGFVAVAILDVLATKQSETPLVFARLRPLQMAIAVLGLLALLANVWVRG